MECLGPDKDIWTGPDKDSSFAARLCPSDDSRADVRGKTGKESPGSGSGQERLQHLHRDRKAMERSDIRSLLKLLSHYPMTQWWWFGAQDFVIAPGEPCTKLHPFWPSNLLHLTGSSTLEAWLINIYDPFRIDRQNQQFKVQRIVLQQKFVSTSDEQQGYLNSVFCSVGGGDLQFSNMCLHAACQEPFCLPMMPGKLSVASPVLDSFPQKTRGFGMWPS